MINETKIATIDHVRLVQFYGGKKYGLGLHLSSGAQGFDLNKKQVQQLVKELQNWLGEVELPFDTVWTNKKEQFQDAQIEARIEAQEEREDQIQEYNEDNS